MCEVDLMFNDLVSREGWNYERVVYQTLRADASHIVEAIDAVPWTRFQAVDGEASEAPLLLRGLLSMDRRVVEYSGYLVGEYLCHQGTVYQATPLALPILLATALDSANPGTLVCLSLLALFAEGQSRRPDQTSEARVAPGLSEIESSIQRWFLENLSPLGSMLESPSPAIRCCSAEILSRFPEVAATTRPRLESAYLREQETEAKAALRRAIDVLQSGNGRS